MPGAGIAPASRKSRWKALARRRVRDAKINELSIALNVSWFDNLNAVISVKTWFCFFAGHERRPERNNFPNVKQIFATERLTPAGSNWNTAKVAIPECRFL
jgi:hypothetical protein